MNYKEEYLGALINDLEAQYRSPVRLRYPTLESYDMTNCVRNYMKRNRWVVSLHFGYAESRDAGVREWVAKNVTAAKERRLRFAEASRFFWVASRRRLNGLLDCLDKRLIVAHLIPAVEATRYWMEWDGRGFTQNALSGDP